jgi:hypothetical protein
LNGGSGEVMAVELEPDEIMWSPRLIKSNYDMIKSFWVSLDEGLRLGQKFVV